MLLCRSASAAALVAAICVSACGASDGSDDPSYPPGVVYLGERDVTLSLRLPKNRGVAIDGNAGVYLLATGGAKPPGRAVPGDDAMRPTSSVDGDGKPRETRA